MKQQLIFKRIIPLLVVIMVAFISYCFVNSNENTSDNKTIIQDKGISVEEFQKRISQKDKLVFVYFNASWCVPCIKLKPEIAELEKETKAFCEVLQINTDDNPKVAEYYEINSLPLFVIYKDGKKLWENIGTLTKTQLQSKIEAYSK